MYNNFILMFIIHMLSLVLTNASKPVTLELTEIKLEIKEKISKKNTKLPQSQNVNLGDSIPKI